MMFKFKREIRESKLAHDYGVLWSGKNGPYRTIPDLDGNLPPFPVLNMAAMSLARSLAERLEGKGSR